MKSLILTTATRALLPLLLLFSLFLLLRGHNEPGGGFVGGLVAAAGVCLYGMAEGFDAARRLIRVDPVRIAALGLAVALISGLAAWSAGVPAFTGLWYPDALPIVGKTGTPVLFDVGVYLLVIGIVLTIVFELADA